MYSEYESYKKEFALENYTPVKVSKEFGELIVILNNGLAPIRSETIIPIYSSEVQKNLRVAFPVYAQPKSHLFTPRIEVDNKQYSMETVEDVDAQARYSLQQAMPGIMARAVARAVVKYNTQKQAEQNGSLASLIMTVTNLVTERADTRSWSTLPQEIQLQRILLPVGSHPVQLQLLNAAGGVVDVIDETVEIKPERSSFIIKHWNAPVRKKAAQQEAVTGLDEQKITESTQDKKTVAN